MPLLFKRNKHSSTSPRDQLHKSASFKIVPLIPHTESQRHGYHGRKLALLHDQEVARVGAQAGDKAIWRRNTWASASPRPLAKVNTTSKNIVDERDVPGEGPVDWGVHPLSADAYRLTEALLQAGLEPQFPTPPQLEAPPSTPLDYGSPGHYHHLCHHSLQIRDHERRLETDPIIEGVTYDAILVSYLNSKLKKMARTRTRTRSGMEVEMDREKGPTRVPRNSPVCMVYAAHAYPYPGCRETEGEDEGVYRSLVAASVAIMEGRSV